METILLKVTEIIVKYESGEWQTAENLRLLLRELTSNIYYLTKYNIEYHEKHNAVQYKHKGSVSSGLILANEQYPELRMLRKIMESANNVTRSMTMELSIIKSEK
jgi:hypothetical protein